MICFFSSLIISMPVPLNPAASHLLYKASSSFLLISAKSITKSSPALQVAKLKVNSSLSFPVPPTITLAPKGLSSMVASFPAILPADKFSQILADFILLIKLVYNNYQRQLALSAGEEYKYQLHPISTLIPTSPYQIL